MFFTFLSFYSCLSAPPRPLSLLSGCFISLLPSTPRSPASPGAFILAGCFLYENTPIGRQAPLSDTIHCTCIDMKSVLTSTAEFRRAAESAYQWRCRSCDQIKEAEEFGDSCADVLVRHESFTASRYRGKLTKPSSSICENTHLIGAIAVPIWSSYSVRRVNPL